MSDKRTKENARAWLGNLSPLRNGFPCWEDERDSKKQVFAPTSRQTSFPESRHPSWRGWAGFTPCPIRLPAQGLLQWLLTSSIPCLMHGAIQPTAPSSSLADAPSSPPVPACHSNVFFRIFHLSFHAHWGIWELFGSALLWDLSAPRIKINGMNHARAGCLRHVRLWLPIIFQPVFQFQPNLTEGQMMLGHKVPTGSVKTDAWIEEIGKVTARKAAGSARLSWDRSIP